MKKIIVIVGFFSVFASAVTPLSAGYFNAAPIVRCEAHITQTLQAGKESVQVHIMQLMLMNAGFLQTTPNGYFGYQTQNAVRQFQASNGITPTGVVGPSTKNAINEQLCNTDLLDNSYQSSNNSYGYSDGITYVADVDPYVRVISPNVAPPIVYNTPQNSNFSNSFNISANTSYATPIISSTVSAQTISQIQSTNIIYSPSIGYTYGITPQSGSITVSSPVANTVYNEGDVVYVNWRTNNLTPSTYSILLESTITRQSKTVATVSGNSYSFVLTKELLDVVCGGICDNNQQGSFKVIVSTPTTDIAGITSNLRAAVAPITIRRPSTLGQLNVSANKSPVSSGEIFKLYINVPVSSVGNGYQSGSYSLRVRAVCPNGVQVSIAGTPCGQEFSMPVTSSYSQQEVPAIITNTTWYKQDVTFVVTAVNPSGQAVSTKETKVSVNAQPFSW